MPKGLELETRIAKEEQVSKRELLQLGDPSVFTCPECHGALLQLKHSPMLRFRCHTGHAFSLQSLLAELNTEIENNLWNAIRTIEEQTGSRANYPRVANPPRKAKPGSEVVPVTGDCCWRNTVMIGLDQSCIGEGAHTLVAFRPETHEIEIRPAWLKMRLVS